METVAIVGDTHSDAQFVSNVHNHLRFKPEVRTIVQLGDFGFTFDKNMIASIEAWLARDEERNWFWLDGNHDQHDFLDELTEEHGKSDPINMGCMNPFGWSFPDRLWYCPRGSTTVIGESLCLFMGGAYSIDKAYRQPHVSWWSQELITEADIRRAEEFGKVDVVFSHDMPIVSEFEQELNKHGYKVGPESLNNRLAMNAVVAATRPQDLYHGHYHTRHTGEHTTPSGWVVDVHGVGANVNDRGYLDHACYPEHNVLIREL